MKLTLGEKLLLSVPVLWLIVAATIAAALNTDRSEDSPQPDSATPHHSNLAVTQDPLIRGSESTTNSFPKGNWFNRHQSVLRVARTGIWDSEPLCYHYRRTATRPMSSYFLLPVLPGGWGNNPPGLQVARAGVRDDVIHCHQSPSGSKREFLNLKQETKAVTLGTVSSPSLGAEVWELEALSQALLSTAGHPDLLGRDDAYMGRTIPLILPGESRFSEQLLGNRPYSNDGIFFGITLDTLDTLPAFDFEVLDPVLVAKELLGTEAVTGDSLSATDVTEHLFFGAIPPLTLRTSESPNLVTTPNWVKVPIRLRPSAEALKAAQDSGDRPDEDRPIIQLDPTEALKAAQDSRHRPGEDKLMTWLDSTGEPMHLPLDEEPSETPESVPEPSMAAALLLVLGGFWKLKRKS
ncbi:MAG: PEP-CTERM sorting domain-containing protein [Cyanobacteria bacterium J06559_3]